MIDLVPQVSEALKPHRIEIAGGSEATTPAQDNKQDEPAKARRRKHASRARRGRFEKAHLK